MIRHQPARVNRAMVIEPGCCYFCHYLGWNLSIWSWVQPNNASPLTICLWPSALGLPSSWPDPCVVTTDMQLECGSPVKTDPWEKGACKHIFSLPNTPVLFPWPRIDVWSFRSTMLLLRRPEINTVLLNSSSACPLMPPCSLLRGASCRLEHNHQLCNILPRSCTPSLPDSLLFSFSPFLRFHFPMVLSPNLLLGLDFLGSPAKDTH